MVNVVAVKHSLSRVQGPDVVVGRRNERELDRRGNIIAVLQLQTRGSEPRNNRNALFQE
jgi:hypothetical protein